MLSVTQTKAVEWAFVTTPDQRFFEALTEPVSVCDGPGKYQCCIDIACLGEGPEVDAMLSGIKRRSLGDIETVTVKTNKRPTIELGDRVTEEEVVHRYGLLQALGRPMGYGHLLFQVRRYDYENRFQRGTALILTGVQLLSWEDKA